MQSKIWGCGIPPEEPSESEHRVLNEDTTQHITECLSVEE